MVLGLENQLFLLFHKFHNKIYVTILDQKVGAFLNSETMQVLHNYLFLPGCQLIHFQKLRLCQTIYGVLINGAAEKGVKLCSDFISSSKNRTCRTFCKCSKIAKISDPINDVIARTQTEKKHGFLICFKHFAIIYV